jgi:hypothetical protein
MPALRGDYLGLVTQNLGGNKIDWFLRREVSYDVTFDAATRRATGHVRVLLHNDAPPDGLSELVIGSIEGRARQLGANRTWFNLYTALPVRRATRDGQPLALATATELGRNVASGELVLAPGSTTVIEIDVDGVLDSLAPGDPYRVDVLGQPVVGNDELEVVVDGVPLASGPQAGSLVLGPR